MIVEHNIKNEAEIVIQGKGNYCSKFKKGKLKTKTGEQEHSIQLAERTEAVQVWQWGDMYLPKPGKWPS